MSEIVVKNPEWLIEQIEAGISGYLERESEHIIDSIKNGILEQIHDIMYLEHSESDATEGVTVSIEFTIPSPEECTKSLMGPYY